MLISPYVFGATAGAITVAGIVYLLTIKYSRLPIDIKNKRANYVLLFFLLAFLAMILPSFATDVIVVTDSPYGRHIETVREAVKITGSPFDEYNYVEKDSYFTDLKQEHKLAFFYFEGKTISRNHKYIYNLSKDTLFLERSDFNYLKTAFFPPNSFLRIPPKNMRPIKELHRDSNYIRDAIWLRYSQH